MFKHKKLQCIFRINVQERGSRNHDNIFLLVLCSSCNGKDNEAFYRLTDVFSRAKLSIATGKCMVIYITRDVSKLLNEIISQRTLYLHLLDFDL